MKRLILSVCFFLYLGTLYSQDFKSVYINPSDNGIGIKDYLSKIEQDYDVDFIYDDSRIGNFGINGVVFRRKLLDYLDIYFEAFELKVVVVKSNVALILPKNVANQFNSKTDYFVVKPAPSGRINLIGEIYDTDLNEPLIGAQVVVESINAGGVTNLQGEFSISYETNEVYSVVRTQYKGFDTILQLITFSEYGDEKMPRTLLYPSVTKLEDVIIRAQSIDKNVSGKLTGIENLGIESIKSLPTFMGEVDLINGLTTLPGVSTVGELASGFNVRGGNLGQNLIRQDGAIIYNPSHLFGFYSAFNPDIVDDVTLIKGGGNARYGSRVSSTMDVTLRSGETRDYHATGGLGIVSSRLTLEGPLVKNKSSFILGGRISYADWALGITKDLKLTQSSADFGDVTAKLFQMINENNFISLSAYSSFDSFSLASDSLFTWGNKSLALKWGHNFSANTGSQLTLAVSAYNSELQNKDAIEGFTYENGITSTNLIYNVDSKFSDDKQINFGVEANYSQINPGESQNIIERSNVLEFDIDEHKALETAAFVQYNWDITPKFAVSAGLRYSQFYRFGKGLVYDYNYNIVDSQFPERGDSINYDTNELIDFKHGLEPRVSFRYKLDISTSLKASYYRTYQYIHLISNTTSSSPLDYWLSGGPNLEPQRGDQFSLGVFKNLKDNKYELSVEGYYKDVKNTIDYIEGAEVKLSESIEGNLIQGNGISYGIEFLARKNTGALNGWLSYTYSRSLLRFNSDFDILTVNQGDLYPSQYDQPHNLSVVMNYAANEILSFSANFSYSTGRPITVPISKYSYNGFPTVNSYSQRNEFRVPDYHRLDLSVTLKGEHPEKRFQGEWVLSIFNVYGRNNVFAVAFDEFGRASKVSIVGNMFPSLSYNFKF
ncbi:MAG: carboxypeptidase-like regulatory domain-containing protein [Reichenbachiella sp.]|uniref:TonB-dependent receptor n=1 Tax=Reichenbachiella sp. TaxID=2184521 RepID=UPI0032678EA1